MLVLKIMILTKKKRPLPVPRFTVPKKMLYHPLLFLPLPVPLPVPRLTVPKKNERGNLPYQKKNERGPL